MEVTRDEKPFFFGCFLVVEKKEILWDHEKKECVMFLPPCELTQVSCKENVFDQKELGMEKKKVKK